MVCRSLFQTVGPWYTKEHWPDNCFDRRGWKQGSVRAGTVWSGRNVTLEDVSNRRETDMYIYIMSNLYELTSHPSPIYMNITRR